MEYGLAVAAIVAVIAAADADAAKAIQPNKNNRDDDKRPHAGVIAVSAKRVSVTIHIVTSNLPTFDFVVVGGLHDHTITLGAKRLLFSARVFHPRIPIFTLNTKEWLNNTFFCLIIQKFILFFVR